MKKLYIIEARDEKGKLKFDCPQPEELFGIKAITGISAWEMSQAIYYRDKECILTGDCIPLWPRILNKFWTARLKTW